MTKFDKIPSQCFEYVFLIPVFFILIMCSSSTEEEEEYDLEDEEDENLVFKSDHEFSPESDVEEADAQPIKRARTAKKGMQTAFIDNWNSSAFA